VKDKLLNSATPSKAIKTDDSKLLAILARTTQTIRRQGWRRRRDFSLALVKLLGDQPPPDRVRNIALRITGVEPVLWLTRSEAVAKLKELKVRIYPKKLSRLAEKAALNSEKCLTVAMNAKGESDAVDSPDLKNPVVIIDIRIDGAVHYHLSPFHSNQGHHGDFNLN